MLQLGTAMMSVTAVIEIAVRNAICEKISPLLGPGWLRSPPAGFAWEDAEKSKIGAAESSARKALYAKMPYAHKKALDLTAFPHRIPPGKMHDDVSKARLRCIGVTDGQIIAQLTMAFWKRLFSSDYEHVLWARGLKYIFPDKALKRADIAKQFEEIYQARNRIAHHEPIYDVRLERVKYAMEFVLQHFGVSDETGKTPLAKLLSREMDNFLTAADVLEEKIGRFRQAASKV